MIVQKPMTTSIKLDNNLLASWEGLDEALRAVMHHPMELAWLDLSHNELTGVDDVRAVHWPLVPPTSAAH